MKPLELDVHTHTLASGHAYGTLTEMVHAAAARGLRLLGVTEHARGIPGTCDELYFINLDVVPRRQEGIDLMLGSEINILNSDGRLSLENNVIRHLDLRIAGIHRICYTPGSVAENTRATVRAMENPRVDIISHPDDSRIPLDYDELVRAAADTHTLLEINNNALRSPTRLNVRENCLTILRLCAERGLPVLVSSDAHHMADLANMDHVAPVLEAAGFPEELVINYSARRFQDWIAENRRAEGTRKA